jgi:hypothetical protein
MRDMLHNDVEYRFGAQDALSNDTAIVSEIFDLANREACEILIAISTLSDANATFVVLVEHGESPTLADNEAVPDALLLGNEAGAGFQYDDDEEIRKIGYIGNKRYLRVTVTPTGNTGTGTIGIIAALAGARKLPKSTQ